MNNTTVLLDFVEMVRTGRAAALDSDGHQLILRCSRAASEDKLTWGIGAIPIAYPSCKRLLICEEGVVEVGQ